MTILWNNEEYINDNALTVNISRLRSKLEDFGYPNAIETRKEQITGEKQTGGKTNERCKFKKTERLHEKS